MSTYTDAIDAQLEGLETVSAGHCTDCDECGDEDAGHFSWSSCDCCGSTYGGDRYPGHGLIGKQLVHLDICTDCLMYLANGDEPDEWKRNPND